MIRILSIFCLLTVFGVAAAAQTGKLFLGLPLRAEVRAIADEVERKTGNRIVAVFEEFEDEDMLGSSFIHTDGIAYLRINENLRTQKPKLEAVIAHELLHMRLRADGFPVFLFARSVKTARGLAQDVEQPNVNDVLSMIEHRIFKPEMDRLGLNQVIDLAGDTERSALRRKGELDRQADSINFARAVLEYQTAADVERLRKIYVRNKWLKSLKTGQEIADLISRSPLSTSKDSTAVFRQCLAKLYPTPRPFKLTPDNSVKPYRQFIIGF